MIKILDAGQLKLCDQFTIEHEPIPSIDLMERASCQLFNWIVARYRKEHSFIILAGTGNNGGDTLALARLMFQSEFKNIKVCLIKISNNLSTDCQINLNRLQNLNIKWNEIIENEPFPEITPGAIIIDGIFGSGLNRPVTGYWAQFN
jgi:NAD(P)H-hydrate epimerase